ncbi:MAG: cytochrome b N-terminal domain-containing protein [Desulfobacteraceae bacterium]|nr:cytochrome b N-terminal domain-containing protein [Desulfobacteraceae bacterium]
MKLSEKFLQWLESRTGLVKLIVSQAVHPVPPGARWKYVFGSAVLTAFILQVVTGVGLLTTYVSSSGGAYQSLKQIDSSQLGTFLRGMHWWGASAMVVMIIIHLCRVFLTGSYKFPREANWLTGVLLLGLTIVMAFSGQIMRWDQDAIWSLVVGADMAGRVPLIGNWLAHFMIGGEVLGSDTLSRIFDVHVFVVPLLIASVVGLHLYLVLYNGVSEPPVPGQTVNPATYRSEYEDMLRKKGVPFWPEAAWRDMIFSVAVVAGILLLAWIAGPHKLGKPPDASQVIAHPMPDWYLLWFYAMLALLPHSLENYIIVAAPILIVLVLVFIPLNNRGERHPVKRPLEVTALIFVISALGAFTMAGKQEPWYPHFNAAPLTADIIGASSGPVYDGAMVFNEKGCIYCHTIEGHGGKRGPDLTYIADRLTRNQLTLRFMNGAYNMPVFAHTLTTTDTEDLLEFLSTRKRPGYTVGKQLSAVRSAGPPSQAVSTASEGLAIAKSKGCLGCHSTDGKPMIGPSWKGIYGSKVTVIINGKRVVKTVDENYLKFMITNPDVWIVKGYQPIMPKISLSPGQVDKIIAYIKTLK